MTKTNEVFRNPRTRGQLAAFLAWNDKQGNDS